MCDKCTLLKKNPYWCFSNRVLRYSSYRKLCLTQLNRMRTFMERNSASKFIKRIISLRRKLDHYIRIVEILHRTAYLNGPTTHDVRQNDAISAARLYLYGKGNNKRENAKQKEVCQDLGDKARKNVKKRIKDDDSFRVFGFHSGDLRKSVPREWKNEYISLRKRRDKAD